MPKLEELLPLPEPSFTQVGIERGTNRRVQIKNFTADQLRQAQRDALELAAKEIEGNLGGFNWASENAEKYHAQDEGMRRAINAIRALITE